MAEITAAMVKTLREKTDAPMMECKKALTEAEGDLARAEEILRVKLGNKASKASSRVAAEGIVGVHVSADRKQAAIVEVNCETDFVAKNDDFLAFAARLAELVVEKNPVGLERVLDRLAGLRVLLLHRHGPTIEVEPHQRGFPALPRDRDLRTPVRGDRLPDVLFHHLVRHAEAAARIQRLLLQEKAVRTVQVAGGAGRLRHHVEGSRGGNSRGTRGEGRG